MRSIAILLVAAVSLEAQEPRPSRLTGSGERLSAAFISIGALRELVDGRVVVIDRGERTVSIGDFATQRATPVSRQGAGPLEYLQPRGAFGLPDGSTLISDPANGRFLRLSPDGRPLGPWRATRSASQQGTMLNLSAAWDARASDALGRLYFEVLPGPLQPRQLVTVPIVRMDLEAQRMDTVASYTLTADMQSPQATPGGRGRAIIRPRAWPPRPEWGVAPNGNVALVTPTPYRVSSISKGQRTDGPPVVVQELRVSDADRAAFTEATLRGRRGPSSPGAELPRPANAPPPTRKVGGEPLFPEVMPPFTGRDAVHVSPDGRTWVTRSSHASDSAAVIDVFGPGGRLEARIELPPHRRLLGFSASRLYLAFRDEDDLEFLERYPRSRER
jgi:hypothetical protein